jgi:hypothetical protein
MGAITQQIEFMEAKTCDATAGIFRANFSNAIAVFNFDIEGSAIIF